MDVSVLISTRGRPGRLAECVARLAGLSLRPRRYREALGVACGSARVHSAFAAAIFGRHVPDPDQIVRVYRKHVPIKRHRRRLGFLRKPARTTEPIHATS